MQKINKILSKSKVSGVNDHTYHEKCWFGHRTIEIDGKTVKETTDNHNKTLSKSKVSGVDDHTV